MPETDTGRRMLPMLYPEAFARSRASLRFPQKTFFLSDNGRSLSHVAGAVEMSLGAASQLFCCFLLCQRRFLKQQGRGTSVRLLSATGKRKSCSRHLLESSHRALPAQRHWQDAARSKRILRMQHRAELCAGVAASAASRPAAAAAAAAAVLQHAAWGFDMSRVECQVCSSRSVSRAPCSVSSLWT
jgi:hypothetical protein